MQQRKILITGASRGIGKAVCDSLLGAGHTVIGIARSFKDTKIRDQKFTPLSLDLSDTESVETAIQSLLREHSDISGLVNNAGTGLFGSLEEFSLRQIEQSLQINLISSILLTRLMINTLKKQMRSDIVFIGSESGLTGGRYGSVYSAAKFGLRGFAQSLRHECANNNSHIGIINPGMVRSNFFDHLAFEPGESKENALLAEDVSAAVMTLFQAPDHAMIEEINLNPLKRVVRKK